MYIAKLADNLRADKRKYAEIITREMGKPIRESVAEIEKCALACDYYAQNAEEFLEPEKVATMGRVISFPAARHRAWDYAVEFPVLAGVPVCNPRARRRERRASQTRI